MSFFCLNSGKWTRQIRLAFSNLSINKIEQGIAQLSTFVKSQIGDVGENNRLKYDLMDLATLHINKQGVIWKNENVE
jgi:hypothetical protein